MSLFTNSEANACVVHDIHQDGDRLIIGVQDGNQLYSFSFNDLNSSSSTSDIKSAVVEELLKRGRRHQLTNVVKSKFDENGDPI